MIKKTIEYTDYNDEAIVEDFYFNLSEAELVEMDYSEAGGLEGKLKQIVNEKDAANIIKYFKEILLASYGVKSPDGRRFIKNDETRAKLEQSPAYSIIFMELLEDEQKAIAFIDGIIPKNTKIGDNVQKHNPLNKVSSE